MSSPSRAQILRLYKDLLRYGDSLKLTDKNYFRNRIKKEFLESKTEERAGVKNALYEVDHLFYIIN